MLRQPHSRLFGFLPFRLLSVGCQLNKLIFLALVGILGLTTQSALAACSSTVSVKDSGGSAITFCVGTDGGTGLFNQSMIVDGTAGANRLAVNASGQLALSNAFALDASVGTTNTDLGAPGATACATDTGSCSLNAILQRLAQRLTTINATLNAPFQAGGALAANQSVNLTQVGGSAVATGHGTASGAMRVELPTDGTGTVVNAAGSAIIGKISQVDSGGTDATDTTNHAVKVNIVSGGTVAQGSSTSGQGQSLVGSSQSGATGGQTNPVVGCDQSAFYDASTNGKTKVITGVSSRKIQICGFVITTGATTTNVSMGSGTGTNCGTTYNQLTPAFQLAANDKVGANSAFWNGLQGANNADDWCINTSAGNAVQAIVLYAIR